MKMPRKKQMFDFSGYATRNDLLCTDGRTIRHGAFADADGAWVPLVYQHINDDPTNVIGKALLENRDDGVYCYGSFNDTPKGRHSKELVHHGDIRSLSICADKLKQTPTGDVLHGRIKEVSLVWVGANPGAYIDNLSLVHSDGSTEKISDEAVITIGEGYPLKTRGYLMHEDDYDYDDDYEYEDDYDEYDDDMTVGEVFDTLDDVQKEAVYEIVADVLTDDDDYDDDDDDDEYEIIYEYDDDDDEFDHSGEGYNYMKYNMFEDDYDEYEGEVLTHADFEDIVANAKRVGSLKEAMLMHADQQGLANGIAGIDYGVGHLELLFPEYQNVSNQPQVVRRDDAWVAGIISGASKTPFSRIKSMTVDLTADIARARGYKKGHLKKEEVIKMAKRTTSPTTIYKKQRLDRDDIIDVTTMDIVAYLKAEMQVMLREEIARAILIGDGRKDDDEDKIDESCIRPILKEDEFYAYKEEVAFTGADEDERYLNFIDQVAFAMIDYKGSGSPTLYTTKRLHTRLKMVRDKLGHKMFDSDSALASAMGVGGIVDVPVMDNLVDPANEHDVLGIIVNMKDYTIGTNRGGQTTFFDDFDIDYNQYKYLYETRLSGALTRPDCAIILERVDAPKVRLAVGVMNGATGLGEVQTKELQNKVAISQTGNISGNLYFKEGFTDFSTKPEDQSGHYLCIKAVNDGTDGEAELYARVLGGKDKVTKKLGEDGQIVIRVTDEMMQKVLIKVVGSDGFTDSRTFSLTGLNLLSEKAPN